MCFLKILSHSILLIARVDKRHSGFALKNLYKYPIPCLRFDIISEDTFA